MSEYIASIGMEVHAELATESKMFCRCPVAFGGEPNTRVCPVCLGLPGALPVTNKKAVNMVMRAALALNCRISECCHFSRKNYFYPDLPKGYQISQYSDPIGHDGWLDIPAREGGLKRIGIRRVHLEEDTGKLMHLPGGGSGVDYNRSGVPLMEIVTEFPPDISNEEEAKEYLVQLRQILLYLDVCDGKMEEGSLRCEPNISVRSAGQKDLGTKTELKNLNSFRSVQLGVKYEIARQIGVLESGGEVRQDTRGWNEAREESFVMRTKETEQDYRYFPDPDLVPLNFDRQVIERAMAQLPKLPLSRSIRYQEEFGLSAKHCWQIAEDREWSEFFEEALALGGDPRAICNLMISDFAKLLNAEGLTPRRSRIGPAHLVDLTKLISEGAISGRIAKDIFHEIFETGKLPSELVRETGASQISDPAALEPLVRKALDENPRVVEKYKSGQTGAAGFFVGEIMKASQGRANPELVAKLVAQELNKA